MRKIFLAFMLIIVSAGASAAQSVPPELIRYADLILHNGKVLTADKNFTLAEAVAVRDKKILAVGSSAEIMRLGGPDTRCVDLRGRSVVPGVHPNNPLMLSLSSSEGIVNTLMLEKAFVAGLRKEQGTNLCPVLWNLRFAGRPKKPRTPATGALHEDFSRRHRSPGDRARWRREI